MLTFVLKVQVFFDHGGLAGGLFVELATGIQGFLDVSDRRRSLHLLNHRSVQIVGLDGGDFFDIDIGLALLLLLHDG